MCPISLLNDCLPRPALSFAWVTDWPKYMNNEYKLKQKDLDYYLHGTSRHCWLWWHCHLVNYIQACFHQYSQCQTCSVIDVAGAMECIIPESADAIIGFSSMVDMGAAVEDYEWKWRFRKEAWTASMLDHNRFQITLRDGKREQMITTNATYHRISGCRHLVWLKIHTLFR